MAKKIDRNLALNRRNPNAKKKYSVKKVKKRKIPRDSGHVEIGPLFALMYKRDGVLYKHVFTSNKPTLCTNRTGNQMFIKGGRYTWTPIGVK